MPVPKGKTSTARRDKRRTHKKLTMPNFAICPVTGVAHLPHRAFWHEDKLFYKGKIVIDKSTTSI